MFFLLYVSFLFVFIRMAMHISTVCDYIVVLFALHSIIRTTYYTNIIYIYLSCMEHLGVQKYMRYYKLLSTSTIVTYQLPRRRIFLGDACTEIAMKFTLRIYDFIEQESTYSFLNCPDPSDFNEFFFHPPTLSHFSIKT